MSKPRAPSLALEHVYRPKIIISIEIWLQAFHVFPLINNSSRYPRESPGLIKYLVNIQDLAFKGHHWDLYEENARF